MNEWILIGGMALVTVLTRYPVLVLVGRIPLPDRVFRALRFVPVAVLTAISAREVLVRDGELALQVWNPYLAGALVAVVVSYYTRNLLYTIIGGMVVFFLWRWLFL